MAQHKYPYYVTTSETISLPLVEIVFPYMPWMYVREWKYSSTHS